jgi:hypothetical protein
MKYDTMFGLFGALFSVFYFIAVEENFALVTYHPRLHQWVWGTDLAITGPAMYWYGWIGTAFVSAALITFAVHAIAARKLIPHWVGWTIPMLISGAFAYTLRGFFFH